MIIDYDFYTTVKNYYYECNDDYEQFHYLVGILIKDIEEELYDRM